MRYTVVWDSAAQDELARIWLKASDPQAVADASDYIDKRLRSFAERMGDAYGNDRRLVIEPLAVIFAVYPDDCLVRILQVTYVE